MCNKKNICENSNSVLCQSKEEQCTLFKVDSRYCSKCHRPLKKGKCSSCFKKARKNTSKSFERRIANDLGGRRQPCSGAIGTSAGIDFLAGDVITDEYLIEAKMRGSSNKKGKYIIFQKKWIERVIEDAGKVDLKPAIVFKFINSKKQYAVVGADGPPGGCGEHITTKKKSVRIYEKHLEDLLFRYGHVGIMFTDEPAIVWKIIPYNKFKELYKSE